VGAIKSDGDASLCDPTRERAVLDRLTSENRGPLGEQGIRNIFQRIIDESLYLQQQSFQKRTSNQPTSSANVSADKRVAILGEPGTFSEEAAIHLLGGDCEKIWRPSFDELFHAVESGEVGLALTPLENSLVGPVHRCFDLLLDSALQIAGEIYLPISQFLIGAQNAIFESVRTVESHPAALGQCEMFFAENPQLTRLEAADTAGSVRRVVESGDPTRAAIGSRRAAEIYGGQILRENIEDHADNWTRFVLLSNNRADGEIGTKVSLVLRLGHKPGSLHGALRPFVRRGINLLKIESRPVKSEPSQFSFYIELEMPATESDLSGALDEIREYAVNIRNLGRYTTIDLRQGANQ
jgi:prephenate dehydratase